MKLQKFIKWQVIKGFRPIQLFESESGLLRITFPTGWLYRKRASLYEFVFPGNPDLILQITLVSTSDNSVEEFNPEKELSGIRQESKFAEIIKVGQYESVHYGLHHKDMSLIDYRWHIGNKKVKSFITLMHQFSDDKHRLDEIYMDVITILQSIKIV